MSDPAPVGPIVANAGQAHLWGAELEAMADLTAWLQTGINYAHGRLNFVSFLPTASAATVADLRASETAGFPPDKLSAFVAYQLPFPDEVGKVSLRATYNWQAPSGDTSVPLGLGVEPAFGLLNLTADWKNVFGKPIDLQLYGSNVTNTVYVTEPTLTWQPTYFGFGTHSYGNPRFFGLRLKYRIGAEAMK